MRPKRGDALHLSNDVLDELGITHRGMGRRKAPALGLGEQPAHLSGRVEVTVNAHEVDDLPHAGKSSRAVQNRIEPTRLLRKTGKKRSLGGIELADPLVEVHARG